MNLCQKDKLLLEHAYSILKQIEDQERSIFQTESYDPSLAEEHDKHLDNVREAKKARTSLNYILDRETVS